MSGSSRELDLLVDANISDEKVLQILDLATEVLEGMDELGISTRAELLGLMERLERLVLDES